MAKPVSILVLCHDLWEQTRRCLESIRRFTPAASYELLVYDNASGDGTYARLREWARTWPQLSAFRNRSNLSFARGINQGMRAARGNWLLWLNNDVVATPGWLDALRAVGDADASVGAVGPLTDHMAPLEQIARPFRSPKARTLAAEASFLGGFCCMVRRKAFESVGLLDERFVWGWEDVDYCLRLRQAGWRLKTARHVFVRHAGGRTIGRMAPLQREKTDEANRQLVMDKWSGAQIFGADLRGLMAEFLPGRPSHPKVSIIVLCRGPWPSTQRCLRTLRRCAGDAPCEVLAVGLGDDETASGLGALARKWPKLRILGPWQDLGRAQALDFALRSARGDYFAILSDEVLVSSGWLDGLIEAAVPPVAVVAPLCKGLGLSWQSRPMGKLVGPRIRSVSYVRGHCLLIPKEVWRAVGEFDSRFERGLWAEDYCCRAIQRGFLVVVAENALVCRRKPRADEAAPADVKLLFQKWAGHPLFRMELRR